MPAEGLPSAAFGGGLRFRAISKMSASTASAEELLRIALELADLDHVPGDSGIYVSGDGIRRVLFGLDIGTGELLLARELGYQAVIAHHPVGLPHLSWTVFGRHIDLMAGAGVPRNVAARAVNAKMEALRVSGQSRNYERVPMAARLMGLPFLNIHAPLDEIGRRVMQDAVDAALRADPDAALGHVAATLAGLPAARRADTEVMVLLGDPTAGAGKVVVAHGALTNGGYDVARAYFDHGVDTVIYLHVSPEDLKRLREDQRGQLIVTGHLVGDAFGIEPYIRALRVSGLEVGVLSQVVAGEAP